MEAASTSVGEPGHFGGSPQGNWADPRFVFLTLAAVFEFEYMKTSLSTFDRIGVVVVALLGTCLGLEGLNMATANDSFGLPAVAVILPGAVIGFLILKFVGFAVAVIVSGVSNGVIYGVFMYGWNRLANRISGRERKSS